MFSTFSLHKIADSDHLNFDAGEYSRFKFGDGELAQNFGNALARQYIGEYETELREDSEITIVPSPFHAIPTASYNLTTHFVRAINHFRFKHGKKALQHAKIGRNMTYTEDYGEMSFEDRIKLISSTSYSFDAKQFDQKKVILTDDIRITGSHELVIRRLLEDSGVVGSYRFVYFAELINKDIPPTFENFLNYFQIKNVSDLISLFNSPTFVFNTRVVKFILKSEKNDFLKLTENSSPEKLKELIALAISNNYHLMKEYEYNLHYLINFTRYGN